MQRTPYRFTLGEAIGLLLILTGVPGAAFGISNLFEDGSTFLGLTELHWKIWAAGAAIAAGLTVITGKWQAFIGVPIIFMLVIVAGINDPNSALSAGYASSPMEQALLNLRGMVKYMGIASPWIFGILFSAGPLLDRLEAIKRARRA
jgi:hypothetical protein